MFNPNVGFSQTDLLVRTKTINPIGNKLGKGCDVLFVLSNVEYVERKLVARLHHHLAGLCARGHHPNLYLLAQSQQAGTMFGSDHKVHIVALHTVKHTTSLKSMLYDAGFRTWSSCEPMIDCASTLRMIQLSHQYCDYYKIGLISGFKRPYTPDDVRLFVQSVLTIVPDERIYWKKSLTDYLK